MEDPKESLRQRFLLAAAHLTSNDPSGISRSLGRSVVKSGNFNSRIANRLCVKCGSVLIPGESLKTQSSPKAKINKICTACHKKDVDTLKPFSKKKSPSKVN